MKKGDFILAIIIDDEKDSYKSFPKNRKIKLRA